MEKGEGVKLKKEGKKVGFSAKKHCNERLYILQCKGTAKICGSQKYCGGQALYYVYPTSENHNLSKTFLARLKPAKKLKKIKKRACNPSCFVVVLLGTFVQICVDVGGGCPSSSLEAGNFHGVCPILKPGDS